MNKYLADTTVLVEHLRGNEKARLFLEKHTPRISTVTVAELIQGSKDRQELKAALKVCTGLSEVVIDKKIASRAIALMSEFYLSHGLLFLDALVAASALESTLILVTGNLKHFHFIKGLKILSQKEMFND